MCHLVILLVDLLIVWFQILGHVCYHILAAGMNGYMATVTNLKSHVDKWKCGAAPITVSILDYYYEDNGPLRFVHEPFHTSLGQMQKNT